MIAPVTLSPVIGSLRFAGDLPPLVVLVVALAAAMAVVWFYLRETRSLGFPYNNLLPALRGAAVAAVIFILAGPVWHTREIVGTLGRVVFAVDTSESMSLTDSTDSDGKRTRLERATALLTGAGDASGWLETLADTHHVDVVSFSSGAPALVWSSRDLETAADVVSTTTAIAELSAAGKRTNLASGLGLSPGENAELSANREGENDIASRSAVVLMTDGRDNLGDSAAGLATELASRGVAVHAIGFGSGDERPDVGILSIDRPESVASDGRLAGSVLVKKTGANGQSLALRIESKGNVVWQTTLEPSTESEQRVPFEFDVEPITTQLAAAAARGVQRGTEVLDLKAIIEPIEGDIASENNSLDFRIAATTRDRRLLVLDGSSRWELRYVRNLFDRDPAWKVDAVLFGPGTDSPRVTRGEKPGTFPSSHEAFSRYDAVLLGEIPPDQFSQVDAIHLKEFVTRGGGLIILDGRYDRIRQLASGPLADLVPVRFESSAERIATRSLEPTSAGANQTTLNLVSQAAESNRLWTMLPPPRSVTAITPQPGAEVWVNAIASSGQQQTPWLVTRLFGAGRVFYFASDETWRWRYKVADRFHSRFWNQLMSAAMQPPYSVSDQYVSIGTDRVEYDSGDSATIRVRLQDVNGDPVGNATVDAILMRDGERIAIVPLAIDDAARGTYQVQTPALDDGHYEIRVQASGYDASSLAASTPIWVGSNDSLEYRQVSLDRQSLEEIAGLTKGNYFHESNASELLEQLKPLSSGMVVENDIVVWQSFYWFWAVIVLLAIEWLLRKRAGLV